MTEENLKEMKEDKDFEKTGLRERSFNIGKGGVEGNRTKYTKNLPPTR